MFESLSGYWGAIHGMNELFSTYQDQDAGWSVLLVDAANAFNSLNHAAMLLHTCVLCPWRLDVPACRESMSIVEVSAVEDICLSFLYS